MGYTYEDLVDIMRRLRGENGCPWDRQQTHESLRGAIIEEVYEFADALDQHDIHGMCEELGDVLMLTVFHGLLAEESGRFTNADVIDGICRKMISRHSHVFGADVAADADEALTTWDKNKRAEKNYANEAERLRSVPKALPALIRAQKVQSRANAAPAAEEALARITAAVDALGAADMSDCDMLAEKIGEILWQISDFSRIYKINADFTLTKAVEKFINRFEAGEIDINL